MLWYSNDSGRGDTSDRMPERKRGEGIAWEGWKRLVNIICFIDLTVKVRCLSFMLLSPALLKIQPQIKNDFLKNLSVFIYLFYICASWLRFCVQVAPISSSLQVTIMVFKTVHTLAKASLALKEGKIIATGQQHKSLQILCLKTANTELPHESSLCCLNCHGNRKRFLISWWSSFLVFVNFLYKIMLHTASLFYKWAVIEDYKKGPLQRRVTLLLNWGE